MAKRSQGYTKNCPVCCFMAKLALLPRSSQSIKQRPECYDPWTEVLNFEALAPSYQTITI